MKIISLIVSAVGMFLLLPTLVFASTLYLSPGKTTIPIGGTVAVAIRLNAGGDAVNAVSAVLSYPADKLDVVYVSPSSAFAIGAENTYGGGVIKVSRGSLSGVSGNVGVATIGFRGKSAGSATVSFIGGSSAPRASDSSDSLSLGGSAGGTFTVGGTAPAPVKKTTTTTTTTTKPVAVVPLNITDTKIDSVSSGSATISWKTNIEADSAIEYGLDKNEYFLSESDEKLTLSHQIKIENPMMTPGLKFHFRVKSKDDSGNISTSEDQEFQIPGFQVKIKVTDDIGRPLSGIEVLLYSDPLKATTDTNGEAIFQNVSEGKHLAVVKTLGTEKTAEVNVLGTSTSQPNSSNNVNIKIGAASSGGLAVVSQSQWITFLAIVVSTIIILAVILLVLKRRYKVVETNRQDTG